VGVIDIVGLGVFVGVLLMGTRLFDSVGVFVNPGLESGVLDKLDDGVSV
jgi:hypothetical protein